MIARMTMTRSFPFITRTAARPATRLPRRLLATGIGVAMLALAFILPAASVGAASAYPPNTVISTYFDGRYGEVSVVTDSGGNLIDINAQTGQRIYPVYSDYVPATGYAPYTYTYTTAYGAVVPATTTTVPVNTYVPYYVAG